MLELRIEVKIADIERILDDPNQIIMCLFENHLLYASDANASISGSFLWEALYGQYFLKTNQK